MKKIILFTILILAVSHTGNTQDRKLTDIRGLIITENEQMGQIPVISANVDLYWNNGKNWQVIDMTITDLYGYFFFYKVYPGEYYVQVNGEKNYKITVYEIDRKYQFQDLPDLFY